jgi:outer membrane protein assembly factor BamB
LAYGDGAVWVANPDGTVTALNASTGAAIGNYSACGAAEAASDIAYSGGDVWVACSNFVTELNATNGSLIGTYGLSTGAARYLTVSSGDVWVAGREIGPVLNGTLTELSAATGAVIATQNLQGVAPTAILSDGTNIWVASENTLVGINASTGSLVLNDIGVNLSDGLASMTFDGSHIWATTETGGLVEIDDPVS